ncbi:MAG: acyl-CoA thioesterase [Selenomonas ruminantium]|nr:acyl-CoA thioesterase [Selenomonas ruminantium]
MPVITEHHVNFYDTDAMAVVHHSNYIRWFEIGRVEYLRSIGITLGELMDDGFVFPITDVRAKYVSPGKFDDVVLIETTPTALTKVKMAFDYRIIRKADGAVMVTGHSQNVFTSKATGHITRLPEKYYSILAAAMAKEKAGQPQ